MRKNQRLYRIFLYIYLYIVCIPFWEGAIPRGLHFICRRFGILCLTSSQVVSVFVKMEQSIPKRRHIKFRRRVVHPPEKIHVHNMAKYLYNDYILCTRHPDDGHRSGRNVVVKSNNIMWLNVFMNVRLLVYQRSTNQCLTL